MLASLEMSRSWGEHGLQQGDKPVQNTKLIEMNPWWITLHCCSVLMRTENRAGSPGAIDPVIHEVGDFELTGQPGVEPHLASTER